MKAVGFATGVRSQKGIQRKKHLFIVKTPLNVKIRTTASYWKIITEIKHPQIKGKEIAVQDTLKDPELIRQSKQDKNVFLQYRKEDGHYICVVFRRLNGDGFIITAYKTSRIAVGKTIWQKNKTQKQ